MKIEAVCEYNDLGYLIYAANFPGAFVRGTSESEALAKFPGELKSYLRWCDAPPAPEISVEIVQRKLSELQICDADRMMNIVAEGGGGMDIAASSDKLFERI